MNHSFSFRRSLASIALVAMAACIAVAPSLRSADVSVTAANVRVSASPSAILIPGTFGETITAGQVVYQSSSDNRFYLTDMNVVGKTEAVGIAINSGAAGQPAIICSEDPSFTPGFTLSTSAPVYVASATAGGIAPVADVTTGWYASVIMVAKSTTTAAFRARGHASNVPATAP